MQKLKLFPPEKLQWAFFGTLDRGIATLSLIFGFLSIVISLFTYNVQQPSILFFYVRDIVILSLLILTIIWLILKLVVVERKARRFRALLSAQLDTNHETIDKFRNHFFQRVWIPINTEQEIDDIGKTYFNHVCRSVLGDTRIQFQNYYNTRGYAIGEDLSLTLKLIISPEKAQELENLAKGIKADGLSTMGGYIVTGYRDPYTWEKRPERREVQKAIYRIDDNTAFDEVLNKHERKYAKDNLTKAFDEGEYINTHHNWRQFYNSTLVVPICYDPHYGDKRTIYYGALTIDSLNSRNQKLFEDNIAYTILANSADTLTVMFGYIDILNLFGYK
jgi:hypothetical protein